MADKPIIFSAPMVRALLEGRKTQTRRVVRQPDVDAGQHWHRYPAGWFMIDAEDAYLAKTPYQTGDRLYVREQCATWTGTITDVAYRADETEGEWENLKHDAGLGFWKMRPSIHMPRWASRLTLTVTDVRVQRLQDISEADAMAEGVDAVTMDDVPRQAAMSRRSDFAALWNSLHGPEAWDANPWVAAYTFRPVLGNIDMLAERARQ